MGSKYELVDLNILSILKFHHPEVVGVGEIYHSIRNEVDSMNVVDRRMQSLRRKGPVYNKKCYGWGLLNHD